MIVTKRKCERRTVRAGFGGLGGWAAGHSRGCSAANDTEWSDLVLRRDMTIDQQELRQLALISLAGSAYGTD
jgi:hypothetical protein